MYRGDDFSFRIQVTDVDDQPVDITGWKFKTSMKRNFMQDDSHATVKVDFSPASGPEAENGYIYIRLPSEQTRNLGPGLYFFDLQREYQNTVSTVIAGRVRVQPDVTWRNDNE